MVNRRVPVRRSCGGFTLIELLTVVVIISLLATLTLAAYRAIAADSRVSVAVNTIRASLDNARAMAIELNRRTMLVFRPFRTGPDSQQVQAVIVVETGDLHVNSDGVIKTSWGIFSEESDMMGLEFRPLDGIEPRLLPKGMMVASPVFNMAQFRGNGESDAVNCASPREWVCQSFLPGMDGTLSVEAPGAVIAVMFDRSGAARPTFTDTGAQLAYIDFNGDGLMHCESGAMKDYPMLPDAGSPTGEWDIPRVADDYSCVFGFDDGAGDCEFVNLFYCQSHPDDEPYVLLAPFFAVFDYDEAREEYEGFDTWSSPQTRLRDLDEFVELKGHAFHFNTFTGLVSQ
ncbi:MAG: type II secretion system GspH family protein [Phycisphaerales bacterium]|nr:type II secretion system GspH family protein [Phycisphaerales bacterium]